MSDLAGRVSAILEAGGGEIVGGERALPLLELDDRAGLAIDASGFVLTKGSERVAFSPSAATRFVEILERPRHELDDALSRAARLHGLPELDLVLAFPAVDLVRAVLAKPFAHTTRLALSFILPSELRELRDDILAVANGTLPSPIRDLARRLVVPA